MFDAPGKKIQGLARSIFLLLASIPVIIGLIMVYLSLFRDVEAWALYLGLIVIIVGIAFAWLSSIVLFAFGALLLLGCPSLLLVCLVLNESLVYSRADRSLNNMRQNKYQENKSQSMKCLFEQL